MARKKVKLAWINNDSARRATLKKRRKGIMKKVRELSVLCDVPACAIIYGPQETAPEVWPGVDEASAVIERFRSMPETEQTKKMLNQERFLKDRIAKMEAQAAKAEKENNEAECLALMFRCLAAGPSSVQALDAGAVMGLGWTVEMKMKAIRERIESFDAETVAAAAAATAATVAATHLLPAPATRHPTAGLGPTVGEELGGLEMEIARRQGIMLGDYNPPMYWPVGTDDAGAMLGFASSVPLPLPLLPPPGFASSLPPPLPPLPLPPSFGDGSNGMSFNNPSNGMGFNSPMWLDQYFHNLN